MEKGEFKKGDADSLSYLIFGSAYSTALFRLREKKDITSTEIYEKYIEVFLNGLLK